MYQQNCPLSWLYRRVLPHHVHVIVVDFVLLVIGLAGVATASVLQVRQYPTDKISWGSRRLQTARLAWVFFAMALLGGLDAQYRLGWWAYLLLCVSLLLTKEVPRRLHNREVGRPDERLNGSAEAPPATAP